MTSGGGSGGAQVLYRKWRPQTLGEVVGQGPITQTLLSALRQDRVGHAYLFCGPRGTGKTSTARILAKAINCETAGGRGEPCNACSPCREITNGSFLDLIEVDGASNRGIDEVRDLREKVRFMPARGRKKVYIIDEVHMLTEQAFNALLKTLEEPPGHAVFILATTEPHKVPLTISSRCQRFDFRRVPAPDATARLSEIARTEGFDIEPEALDVVVRAANGSLRDAANLLEQLALTAGTRATADDAREFFGVAGSSRARDLVAALLGRNDLAGALRELSRLHADGVDMRQVHRELVEQLRTLLLIRAGAGEVLDLSAEEMAEQAEAVQGMDLALIRHALGALAPLGLPPGSPPLPLEMAFVSIALRAQETASGAAGVAPPSWSPSSPSPRLREETRRTPPAQASRTASPSRTSHSAPRPSSPAAPPQRPPVATGRDEHERLESPIPPAPAQTPAAAPPSPPIEAPTARVSPPAEQMRSGVDDAVGKAPDAAQADAGSGVKAAPLAREDGDDAAHTVEELRTRWREIVDGLRGVGSSGNLDAFLRSVSVPVAVDGETLTIGFYHDFHKKKIEDPKYRRLVEQRMTQILGRHYDIKCELVEKTSPRGHLVRAALSRGARRVEQPSENGDDEGEDEA